MRISLVVAHANNRVIGRDGDLPWRLSNDLRNFKRLTMGHTLLMGRKTMDSIGRLLPGRNTIILTRDPNYTFAGADIAHTWQQAIEIGQAHEAAAAPSYAAAADDSPALPSEELFVVGGAEIYRLALPHADRIHLTEVDANVPGDTYFPTLDPQQWLSRSTQAYPADDKNDYPHQFVILDRAPNSSP